MPGGLRRGKFCSFLATRRSRIEDNTVRMLGVTLSTELVGDAGEEALLMVFLVVGATSSVIFPGDKLGLLLMLAALNEARLLIAMAIVGDWPFYAAISV